MSVTWIKLERKNDWGRVFLTYPSRLEAIGTPSRRVSIRWPDGTIETTELVLGPKHRDTVMDMGHTYEVLYRIPGFWAELKGLRRFVELDEVEVLASEFQ